MADAAVLIRSCDVADAAGLIRSCGAEAELGSEITLPTAGREGEGEFYNMEKYRENIELRFASEKKESVCLRRKLSESDLSNETLTGRVRELERVKEKLEGELERVKEKLEGELIQKDDQTSRLKESFQAELAEKEKEVEELDGQFIEIERKYEAECEALRIRDVERKEERERQKGKLAVLADQLSESMLSNEEMTRELRVLERAKARLEKELQLKKEDNIELEEKLQVNISLDYTGFPASEDAPRQLTRNMV